MADYIALFLGAFIVSLTGLVVLKVIPKTNSKFLKNKFLIYSGKSASGAQLLGGLPVAVSIILTSLYTDFVEYPWTMGGKSLVAFVGGGSIIAFYGYLDDRYELRPIAKLMFQVMAVSYFALITGVIFGDVYSVFLTVGLCVYGMGILNGTNLLDGLDTMTLKLSAVVYLVYIWTGVLYNSDATVAYSLICLGALLPFYAVNRYPSTMHLGEIGGTFIGFSYLLLFNSLFKDLRFTMSFVEAFCICVMPMSISMCEVSISFIRRILNEKAPFVGDRFHLHHIFSNYYRMKPSMVTTLFATIYGGILMGGLTLFAFTPLPSVVSYGIVIACICAFQFSFGKRYWVSRSFDFSLKNLLKSLRKDHINVIDASKVDSFEFKVIEHESDDIDRAA